MPWKKSIRVRQVGNGLIRQVSENLRSLGDPTVFRLADMIGSPAPPHSAPLDPPHTLSGELIASLFWEYDEPSLTLLVGSTSMHAVYTEFGTSYEARPWFRSGLVSLIDTTIVPTLSDVH